MDKYLMKLLMVCVAISVVLLFSAAITKAEEPKLEQNEKIDLMNRIDFGNSYILGQSIKSGAVYLLHRKRSDIKSMLDHREDYRKEILEDFKVADES